MQNLRIKEIWLASDNKDQLGVTQNAINKLSQAGFPAYKIRCYVLIGFNGETQEQAEFRLRELFLTGCLPFAQVYDQINDVSWRRFARIWQRPAAMKAKMKTGEIKLTNNLSPDKRNR